MSHQLIFIFSSLNHLVSLLKRAVECGSRYSRVRFDVWVNLAQGLNLGLVLWFRLGDFRLGLICICLLSSRVIG